MRTVFVDQMARRALQVLLTLRVARRGVWFGYGSNQVAVPSERFDLTGRLSQIVERQPVVTSSTQPSMTGINLSGLPEDRRHQTTRCVGNTNPSNT